MLVGVLLGLVLLATYLVTGRGLGATAAFSSVAAWLTSLFASADHVTANAVHSRYWNDGAPLAVVDRVPDRRRADRRLDLGRRRVAGSGGRSSAVRASPTTSA